jgi:predicted helicase
MKDYKREPNTNIPLRERNSKWVNNDYAKFIRLGQYFVDKNSEGVLAYITSNSFIDGPTFRGMRWNLMRSFNKIYILNLHGYSRGKNTFDGGKDENVFDIQEGVSINIFVKTGKKTEDDLADVYHYDLYGKRQEKYDYLLTNNLTTVPFTTLEPSAPEYFFIPKDYGVKHEYDKGFSVTELFPINGVGITTAHDDFVIGEKDVLLEKFTKFKNAQPIPASLHESFCVKEKQGWNILDGWQNLQGVSDLSKFIIPTSYRPFDDRHIFYEDKIVWRCVRKIMRHFIDGENVGLVIARQCVSDWRYVFCTRNVCEFNLTGTAGRFGSGNAFPLYLYSSDIQTRTDGIVRIPNLDPKIVKKIAAAIGLEFEPEKSGEAGKFAPIDLLDYIYAILHSPAYREKYKEFLKIDFPRVPYPTNADEFRRLAALGSELRHLHLMEHPALSDLITRYPVAGSNTVERPRWEPDSDGTTGRVWINADQYFDSVPVTAWNFYIGGYQPAQKWLKDRVGRSLSFDDILHYQRIIKALVRTEEIMYILNNS